MSYISSWRIGDDVCVWERTEQGRITKRFPAPLYFYTKSSKGVYQSIYKEPLTKHTFNNWSEFCAGKNHFTQNGIPLYESDIGPELKVLSQHYREATVPKLHFTLWDIEVDYQPDQGFSSVEDPYAPINAVALHHLWSGESIVIAIPPKVKNWKQEDIDQIAEQSNTTIHLVNDERTLLNMLLDQFEDSDCISGWNSDMFDTPYLAKRVEIVLGKSHVKRLSFRDSFAPRWREVEQFGNIRHTIDLGGRISWDYMALFKKFEMSERPSYSLEAISNEILPDLPKLSYPGTLHQLYNNDFAHFIRYNVRDTEVLKGFEEKLGYLQLANELYHSACGQPKDIFGTIRLTDLSIINHCHYNLNQIVPDLDLNAVAGRITGAMVLVPKRGLHQHIGSIDIISLYPSVIRSINISPDTLIGQFDGHLEDDDRAKHTGWEAVYKGDPSKPLTLTYDERVEGFSGSETHTGEEWRSILEERNWSISGYGTVFRQDKQGIIPAVLTEWFARRKQYKHSMAAAKDAVGTIENQYPNVEHMPKDVKKEYEHQKELAAYYDRLQYVYKIRLNSAYGATTNQFFRFFDLRLGQSTTGTGRAILEHMCAQTALELDGVYDMRSKSIVYGDTDSVYFKTNAETFENTTLEQQYEMSIKIADAIGKRADASFDKFCRQAFCINDEFSGIIKCDREAVAKSGIFVTKKRYVLKLIDLDGYSVNILKAMGLEMKKTTTPKIIQKFLEDVVNMILDGEATWDEINDFIVDYRKQVTEELPILEIGLPKGVKKVEYYTNEYNTYGEKTRLPGHVAAAIFYNTCLKHFDDKDSLPIVSNSKIKVFYLTQKYGKFKSIAIPTDAEHPPKWFEENFTVARDMHEQRLIDNNLKIIFDAIERQVPTRQTQFDDLLLEW